MVLISSLKNCPGKTEIEPVSEKEFIYPIKNDCMTGNSVYSVTAEMEIQFKLSQLLPLTPADQVSLKSLTIFLGDNGTGLKFFSSLLLRSIVIFPLPPSRNSDCHATHHNLYVTTLLLFHVSCFNIPKTPQLCSWPHHKNALFKHRCIVPPQHSRTFSLLFLRDILRSIGTAVT